MVWPERLLLALERGHLAERRGRRPEAREVVRDSLLVRAVRPEVEVCHERAPLAREFFKRLEEAWIGLDVGVGVRAKRHRRERLLRVEHVIVTELGPRRELRREQPAAP